ncbi:MAG: hypothetical protein EOO88_61600 [Pedobacter sp.]|nr:MAG: hypothetical protein EOO88_61600 [Pedobacter sp.]
MQSVHVPHDAVIENNVVLTPMVVMGGLVHLMEGANIAMGASLHQRTVVGAYAIVATGAAVTKNVKPFSRHIPDKPISVNMYAVEKFGFSEYSDEISNYVTNSATVKSPLISGIISRYEELHNRSLRKEY